MNRRSSVLSILSSSTLQSNVILPTTLEPYDYLCKIIIIGPAGSGKTCLLKRFLHIETATKQTIGVEFHSKVIELPQKLRLKLQLWDTAGQERFKSITTSYYRGSSGVIFCFDLTREDGLEILETDIRDVKDLTNHEVISCLIVGNKCDLQNRILISHLQVVEFVARMKTKYAMDISMIYECSSVTSFNVYEVFETISSMIATKIDQGVIDIRDINSGVQLGNAMITHSESNMNLLVRGSQLGSATNGNCCF